MADVTIRWACVNRIVDLASGHHDLADVNVAGTYPGDEAGAECVYCADITGNLEVPVTRAEGHRVVYDDEFEILFGIDVKADGKDRAETMARCEVVISALVDVLATKPWLDGLDGVISARVSVPNGPTGIEFKGVGLIAVAQVVVKVHSRISD